MKFIIITIILSIEFCVTAIPKLRETNKHYVISPFQVELKEKPSEKSKTIQKINPYQEIELNSIEKEEIVLEKYGSSPWAKITYGISQGYIPYYFVEDKLEYIKLKSEAFNGLVLRESPAKLGKKIAVIPLLDEMEFLERTDKKEKISRFNSYWIKVKYKDKIGYVFSGYTNYEFQDNFISPPIPEVSKTRYAKFKARLPRMKKRDLVDFQLYERIYKKPNGGDCHGELEKTLYFEVNDKIFQIPRNSYYEPPISESEEEGVFLNSLLKLNFPFQNIALIQSNHAAACHGFIEKNILAFSSNDKFYTIDFYKNNGIPLCSESHYGAGERKYFSETKYNMEQKILFFHIKTPHCIFEDWDAELTGEIHSHRSSEVANEIFARIDLSGDIPKQTIYYNRGIPNKFLNEWNQAKVAVD